MPIIEQTSKDLLKQLCSFWSCVTHATVQLRQQLATYLHQQNPVECLHLAIQFPSQITGSSTSSGSTCSQFLRTGLDQIGPSCTQLVSIYLSIYLASQLANLSRKSTRVMNEPHALPIGLIYPYDSFLCMARWDERVAQSSLLTSVSFSSCSRVAFM